MDQPVKIENSVPDQTQQVVPTMTPPVEKEPEIQKNPELTESIAFYQTWNFWIIIFLIINLGVAFYIWALPILLPRVVVQNQVFSSEFTIEKVVAPNNGFLVLQKDMDGIPGFILTKTDLLIPDTYTNFKLKLAGEEDLPLDVVDTIKPGNKIYATFYSDVNKDGLFTLEIDSVIPKNLFGSKYQTSFIIKSTP